MTETQSNQDPDPSTQRRLEESLAQISILENKKNSLNEQINSLKEQINTIDTEINTIDTEIEEIRDSLKSWLEEHPDQIIIDGEHNVVAKLQPRRLRKKPATFNMAKYAEHHPNFLVTLAGLGVLQPKLAALRKLARGRDAEPAAQKLLDYEVPQADPGSVNELIILS